MVSFIVGMLVRIFGLVIIVHVLLSYFLPPYHPVREMLNRFVEPLLSPIRRVVPGIGGLDFSPLILLILVQVVGQILVMFLYSLGL